jgi:hypothetical protein
MTDRSGTTKARPAKARAPSAAPTAGRVSDRGPTAFEKEVELYPSAIKLLWHFFRPEDRGKDQGTPKVYSGEVTDEVRDCVHELSLEGLIEVTDSFAGQGVTARLTQLGLAVMANQPQPGHLKPVRITDPATTRVTVYDEIKLGF